MNHVVAIAIEEASPKSPPHVRISLLHWLCWLTVTALLLAIHRSDMEISAWLRKSPGSENVVQFIQMTGAVGLAVCPFHALAICGLALAFWRSLGNERDFPSAPGHWILVCLGSFALGSEFSDEVLDPVIGGWFSKTAELSAYIWWSELLRALVLGLTVVATTIAAWNLRWLRGWLTVVLFGGAAIALFCVANVWFGTYQAYSEVGMWLEYTAKLLLLVAGLMVAILATIEFVRQVCRDLVHWLGIAAALASMVPTIVIEAGRWWAFWAT